MNAVSYIVRVHPQVKKWKGEDEGMSVEDC